MSVTFDQWSRDLLKTIGAPVTLANRRALISWLQTEGSQARFNPLATTMFMPGSTDFNPTHVKNYATLADGLTATARTLQENPNRGYHPILHRLRRNKGAKPACEAIGSSDWGTDGDLLLRVLDSVRRDIDAFKDKEIAT